MSPALLAYLTAAGALLVAALCLAVAWWAIRCNRRLLADRAADLTLLAKANTQGKELLAAAERVAAERDAWKVEAHRAWLAPGTRERLPVTDWRWQQN